QVEYVGKTVFELLVRLDGHYSDVKTGGTSKKAKWIRDVWSRGGEIEISLLCVCSEEQDRKIEEGLIRTYRAINPNLKNGLVKG
ncbi:hypothetical protein LAJ55_14955, partial [Streptococcus pneumoniae]|uniref:hypothetical protein n=1 Tax=Streptococcus pneumoniae TaxID=1313 RepID=UPI001CBB315E